MEYSLRTTVYVGILYRDQTRNWTNKLRSKSGFYAFGNGLSDLFDVEEIDRLMLIFIAREMDTTN